MLVTSNHNSFRVLFDKTNPQHLNVMKVAETCVVIVSCTFLVC